MITRIYERREKAEGTGFAGYINLNYEELKSIFYVPNSFDISNNNLGSSIDHKVDWEWCFSLDELIFTIYNYKTGPSYTKNLEITANDIKVWHIGTKYKSYVKILECFIRQETFEFNDRILICQETFELDELQRRGRKIIILDDDAKENKEEREEILDFNNFII